MKSAAISTFHGYLKRNRLDKCFTKDVETVTGFKQNRYEERVEAIFAIRRLLPLLPEENIKKYHKMADEWDDAVVINGFSTTLAKLAIEHGGAKVCDAIHRLQQVGRWGTPVGMEEIQHESSVLCFSEIPHMIAILDSPNKDAWLAEYASGEESLSPMAIIENSNTEAQNANTESESFNDPTNFPFAFIREQWRPYPTIKPCASLSRDKFIVLIQHTYNNGCSHMTRMATWVNGEWCESVLHGLNSPVVVAWIPMPKFDIMPDSCANLSFPIEILYGELKRRYIELKKELKSAEHGIYARNYKIERLQNILDEEKLNKEEKDTELRRAVGFIKEQEEQLEKLKEEVEKAGQKEALPKVRIIPESRLRELPLIGDKAIGVLVPFLKKYNIIIDENK